MSGNTETTASTNDSNSDGNRNNTISRLISMLVLAISFSIAESVLIALVVGQVLFGLFAKQQNDSLKKLASQIVVYMYETLNYLTFNSEERPFPYRGWDEIKEQPVIVTDQLTENS